MRQILVEYVNWAGTIITAAIMVLLMTFAPNGDLFVKFCFMITLFALVFDLKTSIEASAIDRSYILNDKGSGIYE